MFRISAEPSSRLNWPHSIVFRLRLAAFDVAPKHIIRRLFPRGGQLELGLHTSKDVLPGLIERDCGLFMWTGASKFIVTKSV